MNDDLNQYVPSVLNPRAVRRSDWDTTLTQHSIVSRCSLSLKRSKPTDIKKKIKNFCNKENKCNSLNIYKNNADNKQFSPKSKNKSVRKSNSLLGSLGLSAIEDIPECIPTKDVRSSPLSFGSILLEPSFTKIVSHKKEPLPVNEDDRSENTDINSEQSTATEIVDYSDVVSVSFCVNDCSKINLSAINANIKNVSLNHTNGGLDVECDCEIPPTAEIPQHSDTGSEEGMDSVTDVKTDSPPKKSAVTVNLEIKKVCAPQSHSPHSDKVLILKTDSFKKFTHIIVQPSNCNLVKRRIVAHPETGNKHAKRTSRTEQSTILRYFRPRDALGVMSRSSCANVRGRGDAGSAGVRRPGPASPRGRSEPDTPRAEPVQFVLPLKQKVAKKAACRPVPPYKIVSGTQFAVDAFSYGDIPYVKVYFLTHFHSDHYAGLKRTFSKTLFCSKITADLCISRLGVNPKVVQVLALNETLRIDGVEVTAVDANHCPGAVMLVFSLANGRTILHTGDFRAAPAMESYPVFWNKAVDTVYLDTTYCNPRYDFPTQDHSLEMALYLLRHKKAAVEKAGRKFSTVLIVCGTYTIGKEKFFLGLARRVGCNIWACPEKDRVLQLAEGRSYGQLPPAQCQLHVVPMRDITVEKLRAYLEELRGSFAEVVAFKPSGWETGKSTAEAGLVTIHGIPYSEHSSFSEMIRFVKFLQPKAVIPTVDISGGVAAVQKHFPCPLLDKGDELTQTRITDYHGLQGDQPRANT